MPNPNVFRAAGALGARRRWQPGSSEEELLADLQAAKDDDLIDKVAERAPKMLPAQAGRLRRLVNSPMFPVVLIPNPARERASDRPRKPDVPAAAIAVAYDAAGEPIPPAVMKRILDAVWPLAAAAAVRAGQCADDQPSGGPGQAIEISEPGPCAFTREQLVRVLQTPSVTGALAMIEEQGGCPADLADAILESHICRDCLTGHIHVLAPETGP